MSGFLVRGVVTEIEHNSGTIDRPGQDPVPWATVHVHVGGERVKFPVRQDGTMPVQLPNEGDQIEVGVSLDLKENRSVLRPFSLVATALECVVLATADELSEQRSARSSSSRPARPKAV